MLPPAVEAGMILIAIRIPSTKILPLDDYESKGAFEKYEWRKAKLIEKKPPLLDELSADDKQLANLLLQRQLKAFLIACVIGKKNIGVVGDTGSGKTTLMKSMCQWIPEAERLLTLEDVRELTLPHHRNVGHMLYSRGKGDASKVTPAEAIAACMRLTPSRVLLAELRGGEAWDFLKLLTSGHAGSVTSWHAESCALAFERFMFMAKENEQAASLQREELKQLALLTLDVIIHVKRELVSEGDTVKVVRYVDEVFFDPWAKNAAR